jgi:hypothetical protein
VPDGVGAAALFLDNNSTAGFDMVGAAGKISVDTDNTTFKVEFGKNVNMSDAKFFSVVSVAIRVSVVSLARFTRTRWVFITTPLT